jgi:nitrite reductase/ring-hydroxylating ferredoxin subunit/uncharacterized membrane protein
MLLLHAIIDWIDRQTWLDRISRRIKTIVTDLYERGGPPAMQVRDYLHGTWLGHPLHPILTDIPIGAWSAALTLDAMEMTTGKTSFGKGADTAITVGLVGAAGAAVTGITDWQHTTGRPRRIGSMHAALNSISMVLYVASLISRKNRNRRLGWGLAALGFATSTAAAYLGGHLVYGLKIGVDRSPDLNLPQDFTPALPENELVENQIRKVYVNNIPLLLVKKGSRIYALAETCAHLGGPLSEGALIEEGNGLAPSVVCPWHGSRFSLETGKPYNGPATYIQPCFETRLNKGQIEVRAIISSID